MVGCYKLEGTLAKPDWKLAKSDTSGFQVSILGFLNAGESPPCLCGVGRCNLLPSCSIPPDLIMCALIVFAPTWSSDGIYMAAADVMREGSSSIILSFRSCVTIHTLWMFLPHTPTTGEGRGLSLYRLGPDAALLLSKQGKGGNCSMSQCVGEMVWIALIDFGTFFWSGGGCVISCWTCSSDGEIHNGFMVLQS